MISRRKMIISTSALLAGGTTLLGRLGMARAQSSAPAPAASPATRPPATQGAYTPVVIPNGTTLPWTMEDGCKTFRLTAEPVKREFSPGMIVNCWGYNGQTPGPTIEAVEGDRVRIYVTNRLPEPTSVHWHGIILPNGMDGVGGVTQPHIQPGETYIYEFTLKQHGTQMYHPHSDEMTQMAMGMQGFFIIHPKNPDRTIDRDFCIFLQEWYVEPGSSTPNPLIMTDFNMFTFNSRIFPGTAPLIVKTGQRVRIRFANLSMDSHPIHFHGHQGWITATDGGPIPRTGWQTATAVNVPPGTTHDLEFIADNPGDWPLHCHKNHHAMNAMAHDIPNMNGVDQRGISAQLNKLLPDYMPMGSSGMGEMGTMRMPLPKNTIPMMDGHGQFGPIEMGGMFTLIKIRDGLTNYDDPGWYHQPAGTAPRRVSSAAAATPASTQPVLYTCSMHPQIIAKQPGKCPICGMTLIVKK